MRARETSPAPQGRPPARGPARGPDNDRRFAHAQFATLALCTFCTVYCAGDRDREKVIEMLAARRALCSYARRVPVLGRSSKRAWSAGARARGSEVAAAAVFRASSLRPLSASLPLLHRQTPAPWRFPSRGYAGESNC